MQTNRAVVRPDPSEIATGGSVFGKGFSAIHAFATHGFRAVATVLLLGMSVATGRAQIGFPDPAYVTATGPDQPVLSMAQQADQKTIIAGQFLNFGLVPKVRIVRLDTAGALDPSFDAGVGPNNIVWAVAVQPDTKILGAGSFTLVQNVNHTRVVRFNANGTIDPGFDVGAGPNNDVYSMIVEPAGTILIGGLFGSVDGQPRFALARLKANGALDPGFAPAMNGTVWTMARTADGKLVVGGEFTRVGLVPRMRLARFNADGSLDATFDPGAGPNSTVRSLVAQPDGMLLVGGVFNDIDGSGHQYLCRLDAHGLPDPNYAGTANNAVYAIALQADGRHVVGGDFTAVSGLNVNRVMRLRADGTPDAGFSPGTGANAGVYSLLLPTGGNVLMAGAFTDVNGPNHTRVARLLGTSTATGGEVEFSAAKFSVTESQPTATIQVRRVGPTTKSVTVDYATSNGTALGSDYASATGTITFGVGEAAKTFVVPITSETAVEDDETVLLALSNPTGGADLGSQRTAVLTILNDDQSTGLGAVDTTFPAMANGPVYASLVQPDGKLVVAGDFTGFPEGTRVRIARFNVAGTLDPSFNLSAWINGAATALAIQADGKILVGGAFTVVNGVTRDRVARFNTDGTLDLSFNPGIGPNSTVNAIVVQPDGAIVLGGSFGNFDGDPPAYLVRVLPDGLFDPSFAPRVNYTVWAIARTTAGQLLVGGDFTYVGGKIRNHIARLNADGSLDPAFDPGFGPNSTVRAIAAQSDGKALVGGSFSDVAGTGHGYLCRLDSGGLVDPTYVGTATSTVYALALQADGKVVAGGDFTTISGAPINRVARLLVDGTADPSFVVGAGAPGGVYTLALQSDGGVVVGGAFDHFDGLNRQRLVRLAGRTKAGGGEFEFSATRFSVSESQPNVTIEVRRNGSATQVASVDYKTDNGTANAGDYAPQAGTLFFAAGETKKTFVVDLVPDTLVEDDETVLLSLSSPSGNAVLGGQRNAVLVIVNDDVSLTLGSADTGYSAMGTGAAVYALAVQPDGKLVVGGEFFGFGDGSRLRIARLLASGAVDPSFNRSAWINAAVTTVAVQPDGRLLVGGAFSLVNGVTRNRIARLNADGTLDTSFDPGVGPNSTVNTLLVLPNGSILVGGSFGAIDGEGSAYLARLLPNGDLDPTFQPALNSSVWALARSNDGKIWVGGDFTSMYGTQRNRVARLLPDGTLDLDFDPAAGPNSTVRCIAIQPDGMALIGGVFSDVNGSGRTFFCRLTTQGLPDTGYIGTANQGVYALALQPDGKAVIGGDLSAAGGAPAARLARLLSDGSPDPSFNVGTGPNTTVFALAIQSDGAIVVGGTFGLFNGLKHPLLVRTKGSSGAAGGDIEFSAPTIFVSENQASATIEVRRNGPTTKAVAVFYQTSDGTANAGDYEPQLGQLFFGVGETKKTFTVPIVADTLVEDNKTVLLSLANPAGNAVLGGQRTAVLVIVNDDTSAGLGKVDSTFTAGFLGPVYSIATQPDGKAVVTGDFSGLQEAARLRIARIKADGTVDPGFDDSAWLNAAGVIVAFQADGKILVGGAFPIANGFTRSRLARFNADGTLDPTFNPGIGPNSTVNAILPLSDGRILVGGSFNTFNSDAPGYLVRVLPDGNLDSTFDPQLNSTVWALAMTSTGKLVVGGDFTLARGAIRNRIARFNADDTLDATFDPAVGPNSTVRAIVVQTDDKVVIGGAFSDVNAGGHPYLARLGPNGLPDPVYAGNANNAVYALGLLPDGRLLAGGEFTLLSGNPATRVSQLLSDGKPDLSFNVGLGANGAVYTIALQQDGGVLLGGAFTLFDGLSHSRIVRLHGVAPAGGVPFKFTSIVNAGAGVIQMTGTSTAGKSYMLEYSLDLNVWVGIGSKTATGATVQFTDTNPPSNNRSYRVRNL